MATLDVLTVGDATIDAFLTLKQASLHCRIDKDTCELCVKYGEKIPVSSSEFLVGGNACNVAVGVSRLGFSSSLCAEIGDDEFSEKILSVLSAEHVQTSMLQRTPGEKTTFAVGLNFEGERTLFVSHVKRKHNFYFVDISPKFMYLTSLGEDWIDAYSNALEFIKSSNVKMAFNPGSHQMEDLERVRDILPYSYILFVNKQEAERILGLDNEEDVKKLLSGLIDKGVKIVVITDGENGSYATDNSKMWHIDKFKGEVVERTGAGDAYASGFLGGILSGKEVNEAMRYGAINASSVISEFGAEKGLLTKEVMIDRLDTHRDFMAKEI